MAVRKDQKARTRQGILDAAEQVLDEGRDVTIDAVVEMSGISRATIYRYFDSAGAIVWQVVSDRVIESPEEVAVAAGDDVVERSLAAERAVNDYIYGDPMGVRRFEAAVVQRALDGTGQPEDRPARRLRYIDQALAPLADRMDPGAYNRLRHGLALAIGAESLLALLDTCGLEPDDARDVTTWVVRALVTQAVAEDPESAPGPPA